MDLNRTLTFLGKDPEFAKKLAIGGVIGFVPILNFASLGYAINLFRNVAQGREDSQVLPDWAEFGDHFFKGLSAFVISLCYGAAFGLLYLVVSIPLAFAFFGAGAAGVHLGGALLLGLLGFALFVGFSFLTLMATSLYAETLELGSAFRFPDLVERFRGAFSEYVAVVALWVVGAAVAGVVGNFVPLVGPIVTSLLGFPVLLMAFFGLGHLVRENFQPEIQDPLAWTPGAPETQPRPRPGARKASDLVDRPSETVLTWSTDSDRPEM